MYVMAVCGVQLAHPCRVSPDGRRHIQVVIPGAREHIQVVNLSARASGPRLATGTPHCVHDYSFVPISRVVIIPCSIFTDNASCAYLFEFITHYLHF